MNNDELEKLLRKIVREEAERTLRENTVQNVRLEGHLMKIENRMKELEVSNTRLEKGQIQTNGQYVKSCVNLPSLVELEMELAWSAC